MLDFLLKDRDDDGFFFGRSLFFGLLSLVAHDALLHR